MEGGGFVDCVEGVDKVEGRVCPDGSGVVDCVEAVDGCAVRNKQHSVALTMIYSKTFVKRPLKNRQNKDFYDK